MIEITCPACREVQAVSPAMFTDRPVLLAWYQRMLDQHDTDHLELRVTP